jgi:uncharacterized integral membrane protein
MTNPIDGPVRPTEPGRIAEPYQPAEHEADPSVPVPPPWQPSGSNEAHSRPMAPPDARDGTVPDGTVRDGTVRDSTAPPAGIAPQRIPAPGFDRKGHVRLTRVSGVWIGLIGAAIFLILLVIFIAQNSRKVPLHLFGWHGNFSLALTIVVSAVVGVLVVALPGSVRIFQLRRALRKNVPGGTVPDGKIKADKAKRRR